jgi:hypothetical protein
LLYIAVADSYVPRFQSDAIFYGPQFTVKLTGLLAFMLGATRTARGPEGALDGIVMPIELSLQEVVGTAVPFRITALFPCVAPNPKPEIATALPTDPVVVETALINDAGVPGVLMETLSKVAVAKLVFTLLLSAIPI